MTGEMEAQASNEEPGIATRIFLSKYPKFVRLHPLQGGQAYAPLCTTNLSSIAAIFLGYSSQTADPFLLQKCISALTFAAHINTAEWL